MWACRVGGCVSVTVLFKIEGGGGAGLLGYEERDQILLESAQNLWT